MDSKHKKVGGEIREGVLLGRDIHDKFCQGENGEFP